jgi:transcriptional regulator with XRE-family HTH domain
MDMRKLVGENTARIRKENGLTQEVLAEKSGLSQQYISGLENGQRNPTIVKLFELATALGVSHVELVTPPLMN